MNTSVSSVIHKAKAVARVALDGCPAQTYADMTSLLEDVISTAKYMNSDFLPVVNDLLKEIFAAQQKDDLIKIADFLNFELVYVLENYQK